MTDNEALAIVDTLRRNTRNPTIVAVCDWVTALAARQAVSDARRAQINARMAPYLRKWRARRAAQKRAAAGGFRKNG